MTSLPRAADTTLLLTDPALMPTQPTRFMGPQSQRYPFRGRREVFSLEQILPQTGPEPFSVRQRQGRWFTRNIVQAQDRFVDRPGHPQHGKHAAVQLENLLRTPRVEGRMSASCQEEPT